MTKTVVLCDICNKEGAEEVCQFEERKLDNAGSSENWYYTVDLCTVCLLKLLVEAINVMPLGWLRQHTNSKGRLQ